MNGGNQGSSASTDPFDLNDEEKRIAGRLGLDFGAVRDAKKRMHGTPPPVDNMGPFFAPWVAPAGPVAASERIDVAGAAVQLTADDVKIARLMGVDLKAVAEARLSELSGERQCPPGR